MRTLKNIWRNRHFQIWLRFSVLVATIHFIILGLATSWQFPVVYGFEGDKGEFLILPTFLCFSRVFDILALPICFGYVYFLERHISDQWLERHGILASGLIGFSLGIILTFGKGVEYGIGSSLRYFLPIGVVFGVAGIILTILWFLARTFTPSFIRAFRRFMLVKPKPGSE